MSTQEIPAPALKPKRIRRWAKRPVDPNYDPNAFLSAKDIFLVVSLLKDHEKKIAKFKDRTSKTEQVQVQKLSQVRWS